MDRANNRQLQKANIIIIYYIYHAIEIRRYFDVFKRQGDSI